MIEIKRGVGKHQKTTMPLCKCMDLLHFDYHAQSWSSSLKQIKTAEGVIRPTDLQGGWRGHLGISCTPQLRQHKSEGHWKSQPRQVAYGAWKRFFTPCGLWELLTTGRYNYQKLTRLKGRLNKKSAQSYCAETCLVQEVSELETGRVLWGNAVILWALILDLPLIVILRDWRTARQISSRPYGARLLQHLGSSLALAPAGTTIPARALSIIYL